MKKIQRLPLWMIKISSISVVLPCLAQNNNTYSWQLFKTLKGHTGAVRSVVFSPDGKELISGSRDETIRFWDVRTVLLKDTYSAYNKLRGHIGSVHVVAFGKSPYLFASGSRDGTVVLWGSKKVDYFFKTAWRRTQILEAEDFSRVQTVAFGGDNLLAAGLRNGKIMLWQKQGDRWYKAYVLTHHKKAIYSVAFDPTDSKSFVTGSGEGSVTMWKQIKSEWYDKQILTNIPGLTWKVRSVCFNKGGDWLAVGFKERVKYTYHHVKSKIILFNKDKNRKWIQKQILEVPSDQVYSIAFHPNKKLFAAALNDRKIALFQNNNGVWEQADILKAPSAWQIKILQGGLTKRLFDVVFSVAFSPDGKLLVSAHGDKAIRVWQHAKKLQEKWSSFKTIRKISKKIFD